MGLFKESAKKKLKRICFIPYDGLIERYLASTGNTRVLDGMKLRIDTNDTNITEEIIITFDKKLDYIVFDYSYDIEIVDMRDNSVVFKTGSFTEHDKKMEELHSQCLSQGEVIKYESNEVDPTQMIYPYNTRAKTRTIKFDHLSSELCKVHADKQHICIKDTAYVKDYEYTYEEGVGEKELFSATHVRLVDIQIPSVYVSAEQDILSQELERYNK